MEAQREFKGIRTNGYIEHTCENNWMTSSTARKALRKHQQAVHSYNLNLFLTLTKKSEEKHVDFLSEISVSLIPIMAII